MSVVVRFDAPDAAIGDEAHQVDLAFDSLGKEFRGDAVAQLPGIIGTDMLHRRATIKLGRLLQKRMRGA